ncbi:MAG: hypothetical protein AB8A40_00125 [Prochlorococcus sp.]|jgi:hypothetical protein|nr:hypothetical protein [Prochlorococcaceae cyanobacterium ETNP18_MAG_14]MDP6309451.1 hypothetical protein [Prochlorococcaceae cyanobacterium ETNP14_MAG_4]|tara:strand:- start:1755 stop:2207 length:453 start_codon:yes stop_codon:yes gene_type:complete
MPTVSSKRLPAGLLGMWVSLLALLLQACANTPIGQELANSFDTPPQKPAPETAVASNSDSSDSSVSSRAPAQEATKPDAGIRERLNISPPVKAQPYRITIKLSGADPSAPAEAVTQALRRAGVNFEVVMIERVQAQSSGTVAPAGSGAKP